MGTDGAPKNQRFGFCLPYLQGSIAEGKPGALAAVGNDAVPGTLPRRPSGKRTPLRIPARPLRSPAAASPRILPDKDSAPSSKTNTEWILRRRPAVSRYWVNIAAELFRRNGPYTRKPAAVAAMPAQRDFYWRLVLSAKDIPHRIFRRDNSAAVYVPAVAADIAIFEICAFESEQPLPPLPQPSDKSHILGGTLTIAGLFLCLLFWHLVRWKGLGVLAHLPESPHDWLPLAGLDAYRTRAAEEWWRSVTALTMHADIAHVLSNCVLGILFVFPLCRRAGVGLAFLLVLLSGACGNMLTALLRPAHSLSQGFSTAVFAAAGLLSAFMAVHAFTHTRSAVGHMLGKEAGEPAGANTWRKAAHGRALKSASFQAMLPPGAALAFLAMLGGAGAPGVDYLSHTLGLAVGSIFGVATAILCARLLPPTVRTRPRETLVQVVSFCLAWLLLLISWLCALKAAARSLTG